MRVGCLILRSPSLYPRGKGEGEGKLGDADAYGALVLFAILTEGHARAVDSGLYEHGREKGDQMREGVVDASFLKDGEA